MSRVDMIKQLWLYYTLNYITEAINILEAISSKQVKNNKHYRNITPVDKGRPQILVSRDQLYT
jgi:hypothetical protein